MWTQADAVLLRRNVRAAFFNELEGPDLDLVGSLATTISTEDPTEDYAWLGNVPAVREFVGDRIVKNMVTESFSMSDKTWEATVGFDRRTIEDGKLGQVEMRIRDLAVRARQHRNRRMTQVMEVGISTVGYDGQYFFDTDHPSNKAGGAARDNDKTQDITSTGRATAAEMEISVATIVEHFGSLVDDQVEPMGLTSAGLTFVTPVGHYVPLAIVLGKINPGAYHASGIVGSYAGLLDAKIIVNPYSTLTTTIYAFKTDGVIKPFIFQDRMGIELTDNLDGDMFFRSDKAEFGTRARYEVGYGPWERAVAMTYT
jgi:phage major head subunit gpT-like protein